MHTSPFNRINYFLSFTAPPVQTIYASLYTSRNLFSNEFCLISFFLYEFHDLTPYIKIGIETPLWTASITSTT